MKQQPLEKEGDKVLCHACENKLVGKTKQCYACRNDLTGEPRYDNTEWECYCEEWGCCCESLTKSHWLNYCPICDKWFNQSLYLRNIFNDNKIRWLANMVTHYRHQHRKWDNQHKYISHHLTDEIYEQEKSKVNEQAKRQIVRKSYEFMLGNGIKSNDVSALQGTTKETIRIAENLLNKKSVNKA